MTVSVTASAPGKVVLSGEYSVLDGAPAVAMAVNRRASVTVADDAGDAVRIRAPGYSDVDGSFTVSATGLEWQRGEPEYCLVDAVWREIGCELQGGKQIELNTRCFIDAATRKKMGLGSSAALTVALCAALQHSRDIVVVAQRAHSRLQSGLGSGVDVACSCNGGLIEYRRAGYHSVALPWPSGLLFRVVWTGVEVSTAAKLERFTKSDCKASRKRLAASAAEMAMLWRCGMATDIVAGHKNYNKELQSFSMEHDLGIFDGGHRALESAAAHSDLAYKPCGAGGGDVGIVLGTDAAALHAFVKEQSKRCEPLDCDLDARGVMIAVELDNNE